MSNVTPEFKILNHVIDFMESKGLTHKTVWVSIDEELVEKVNAENKSAYTLDELKRAADKCLANEWLERVEISGGYGSLRITQKGLGAARSRRKIEALRESRSIFKKTSDYIEDHKGLIMVLGFLVALAALALKLFED